MRVMITTSPGIGHILPQIPTAWALRAAGHEVLFAAPSNPRQVADAGLPVLDPAPGFDFRALFMTSIAEQDGAEQAGTAFVSRLFARVSAPSVDEIVRLATDWRPDLIIRGPLEGAGGIAAAVLGIPAVVHGISPGQSLDLADGVAAEMHEHYQRFAVAPVPAAAFVDVSPPGMRAPGVRGTPLRYVPFNSGGVLDRWLTTPRTRRRITVTLGTVLPHISGVGPLATLTAAAADVDAEFVFALGGTDPSALGGLPANVRVVDWVPLNALLSVSDGVVHHGGAGTTMTAIAEGIPQLVLPQGADQFLNADAVARSGAGAVVTGPDLDADRLDDLLTNTARRTAAVALADAVASQPTPAELVPVLEELAA